MPTTETINGETFFVHDPEIWDAKKCEKAAKHTAKDGLGTKYPFKGYIGNHYTKTRYNGGCIRNDEWYNGEIIPLPQIAEGFKIVYKSTWGYQIIKL